MPVISVSLPAELLSRLDALVNKGEFASRSEMIRQAIREALSEFERAESQRGNVLATVTAFYDRESELTGQRLMELRHDFDDLISEHMHLHAKGDYCIEIFVVTGDADRIQQFLTKVRGARGIHQVRHTTIGLEKQ